MSKAKSVAVGAVAFALGFVGAYFFLARIWTHVFARPENVTATDFYLVVALSAVAGIVFAAGLVKWIAPRASVRRDAGRVAHA